MVLSILVAALMAPALLGSQEAIRQGQSKDKREEHRARRCNLVARCITPSARSREIDGRPVVLRNGKLWIDPGTEDGIPFGHRYAGYYLPYPDTTHEGLVTTITDVAPIMNWVYIDSATHEARYGVRADAQPNRTGPFDCTRQDRRLTFDGWEGWCAVEEYTGIWALYFDIDDDGLKSKVPPGTRVLELELARKEKRFQKETDARQQDQTTMRDVDAKQDTPVDRPLAADPAAQRPGVFGFEIDEASKQAEPDELPQPVAEVLVPIAESEPQEPPMPKTPPPAYSRSFAQAGFDTDTPFDGSLQAESSRDVEDQLEEAKAESQETTFLSPEEQEYLTPVPNSQLGETSPSSARPPTLRTPSSEKRITPKLNRNSGNRAMSQAQMFEALAAAQEASENMAAASKNRASSRASSTAASVSVYSDQDGEKILSGEAQPEPPAPQKTPSPVDPTIFGVSSRTEKQRALPLARSLASTVSQRKSSTTAAKITPNTPTSRTSAPRSPALGGRLSTRTSLLSTVSSGAKRPVANRKSRANSVRPEGLGRVGQAAQMRGSRSLSSATPRSQSQSQSTVSLRGQDTASPRSQSTAILRSQSARKTTSTLLRSLDDLVGQEGPVVPAPLNVSRGRKISEPAAPARGVLVRGTPKAPAADTARKPFR